MDLGSLSRTAWRITRTQPTLWVLHGLLLLAGLPTLAITAMLSAWSTARELEASSVAATFGALPLGAMGEPTAATWASGLVLVILFSVITQILLAAIYRSSAQALDSGSALGLRASLTLGRARLLRIVVLSLTLGAALSGLALLPELLSILNVSSALRTVLQSVTSALNLVGGVVFLLLVLAISLDDVRGREAPRRAWAAFKRGWVGFALIVAFTVIWSLFIGLLAVPAIVVVVMAWLVPGPTYVGPIVTIGASLVCGLPLLILVLGGAAYTNIFQALVYRSAIRG